MRTFQLQDLLQQSYAPLLYEQRTVFAGCKKSDRFESVLNENNEDTHRHCWETSTGREQESRATPSPLTVNGHQVEERPRGPVLADGGDALWQQAQDGLERPEGQTEASGQQPLCSPS